jgi:hypothetical protein
MTKKTHEFDYSDSWVGEVMDRARRLPRSAWCRPYARTDWLEAAQVHCTSSLLAPQHCEHLHTQLTVMATGFAGAQLEFGLYEKLGPRTRGQPLEWAWPYAALATWEGGEPPLSGLRSGACRMVHGFLIVPCAAACARMMLLSVPMPDGSKHRIAMPNMFSDLVPVTQPVMGKGTISIAATAIPDRDAVPRSDAFLLDLSGEQSPKVQARGTGVLGPAVQFGGLDEILDLARVRLTFAQLPSA